MTKPSKKILAALANLVVIIYTISCVFPVLWIFYSSLKTQKEFNLNIVSLPSNLNFTNYIEAIKTSHLDKFFLNSVFNSMITVTLVVIIGFMTGYCLSRFKFRGRGFVYTLFLAGMLIPVHSLLIPIFIQFKNLGMLNNRLTLILPYVAFGLPISIFLFESFIVSVPGEMDEAASLDGLNIFGIMFRIILPLCKPVMSTVVILSFLSSWNEFPFALTLIRDDKFKTIPVGLANFSGAFSTNYTQLMAALVIAVLPVILIYLIFNKKVVQGMTAGAVKG
ncbi:sugar ABC transporter permease [Vallitalea longa]|uniref:Sugar ABC transporter permease n=1 Tax=Vallitalea longa TaxID=2936439 RepID=A0A9W5YGV0_9FIRM|nr:carbohydrate ABC transporter permease [Vallitalea longa]GKX32255.1 sugar ABC transporter permease [Vallitalea longa]